MMKMKYELEIKLKPILAALAVLAGIFAVWYVIGHRSHPNPIPESVKSQVQFQTIYPTTGEVNDQSFNYVAEQGVLYYKTAYQGKDLVISEQSAPPLKNGIADYASLLGLKPTSQFDTKNGHVYVVNVYTEEHPVINNGQGPQPVVSDPIGQSAILIDKGTMFIARLNDKSQLSADQWKAFFNSLKLSE